VGHAHDIPIFAFLKKTYNKFRVLLVSKVVLGHYKVCSRSV